MTDFPTSNSRPRKRKPRFNMAWMVLGGLAVLIGTGWFSATHELLDVSGTASVPLDLARWIGLGVAAGLAGAAAVWVVVQFIGGGRTEPGKGALRFAVLAGLAVLAAVPISGFRVMGQAFHDEEAALQEIRLDSQDRIEQHLGRVHNERERIIAGGFMEPGALAQPGGVERARRKLAELRALVARAERDGMALGAEARAEIDDLPVSGPRRRQMQAEFDRGFEMARKDSRQDVELATLLFDEIEAQLDILSRKPKAWDAQGGGLGFARQRDLTDFNARALRIQEISRVMETRDREREARAQAERYSRPVLVTRQP